MIGHRGASGLRPEHTIASYQVAINQGADLIESDVVSTRDHVLVARHENDIGATTDVSAHPEFAGRRTTKLIDGNPVTGWFTEDFTFAELRTLRAKERLPQLRPQNTVLDGQFPVPSLQEVVDLARRNHVGIYPETKHPTYFRTIGLPLEEPLLQLLHTNGLDRPGALPVFIQSFEVGNLQRLHRHMLRSSRQAGRARRRPSAACRRRRRQHLGGSGLHPPRDRRGRHPGGGCGRRDRAGPHDCGDGRPPLRSRQARRPSSADRPGQRGPDG